MYIFININLPSQRNSN